MASVDQSDIAGQYLVELMMGVLSSNTSHVEIERLGFLSSDSLDFDDGFVGLEGPLIRPPTYLFYLGLGSIIAGLGLGILGLMTSNGATNSKQYIVGGAGYVLTIVIPIILLQVIWSKHNSARNGDENGTYDLYGGLQLLSRYRKVVLVGLISAILPIWVFLSPIAEKLA